MDSEDGPNFSYAYGGASATSASTWNPALRPDYEPLYTPANDPNFSEPSLNGVAKPETFAATGEEVKPAEEEELPTTLAKPSYTGDDFVDRHDTPEILQNVPQTLILTNGGKVEQAEEAVSMSETQGVGSEEQVEAVANGDMKMPHDPPRQEWPGDEFPDIERPNAHPADKYEHQGETTLLEDAVIESAKAPLVADPEPAIDDWGSSGEVFDVGGMPQDAPLPTPRVEAAGTTVGDEVIGNTNVGGSAGEEIDWGNRDEPDFFADKASSQRQEIKAAETNPARGNDSMWDLALDDDFLPDTETAVPTFELGDDEGFLDDVPIQATEDTALPTQANGTANRYAPHISQEPGHAPNAFGLQGPQFTNLSQLAQKQPATATTASYGAYGQPSPYPQEPERPALTSSAQSFADKAKGGYHSPYDLPEDIVASRKRPAPRHHSTAATPQPAAPPRSSSIASTGPPRAAHPSNMSTSSLSPPSSSHSMQSPITSMPPSVPSNPAPSKAPSNDFFAELPITSKPKPSGRYTPQQNAPFSPHAPPPHHAPPQFPPKERTSSWSSLRNEVFPDNNNLISQLQQPERLPVFPDQPMAPSRTNSLPVSPLASAPIPSTRYSPVPPTTVHAPGVRYSPAPPAPASNARYSPAPPSQAAQGPTHTRYVSEPPSGPSRPSSQPYAPRTSSPLAFHTLPQDQQDQSQTLPEHAVQQAPGHHVMHSADGIPRVPFRRHLEGVSEIEEQEQATFQTAAGPTLARSETPPLRSSPSSTVGSPRKRSNYTPQYHSGAPANMPSPQRSQSQSPGATMKSPLYRVSSLDRPASGPVLSSPTVPFGAQHTGQKGLNTIPHKRHISHDFQCIPPTDERVADPLERWKGCPIFAWGLGGTVITSFPKQIPRYGGGSSIPMMKCSPGEIKLQNVREALPLSEDVTKFPGPLKSKNKKKDVSAWLGKKIESLENHINTPGLDQSIGLDALKRLEEGILLWKIMQVLVDNDGHLENNATAEAAVRKVLSLGDGDSGSKMEPSFATGADLIGNLRSNTVAQAEPIDPKALEELRTLLTKGDREKAVWHAVDQRLWAHAMLLSSTLNKDVWKQVVQEFVRKEVKKVGRNNQALAVLYEIFAGNWDDCIDELVPASARAGFQMVSTDGAGSAQNVLKGLDKWRETLALVLNNRSDGDVAALLSLGRLLAGYGRVEAAHICFIFARSATYIGGVDDPQSELVLVGTDHRQYPLDLGIDLEPVLLTEVYEFALALGAPNGSHVIPHLQSYKLAHAYTLAEYGHKTDAQAYCDAIAYAIKSTTKLSPYYNASFIACLDDLSKRLSQSPKDGSSSWISKPSMDKVSSSLLSKFNSFIAGDDEDVASNHSAGNDVGPFAKIAGNTPNLSPAPSNADIYGAYAGYGGPPAPPAPANSRYAPSNVYAPRNSLDQDRSRYEPQARPSLESNGSSLGGQKASDSYTPSPQFSGPYTPSQAQFSPPSQQPQAPKAHTYTPLKAENAATTASYGTPYQPTPPAEETTPSYEGYEPPTTNFDAQPPSPPTEPTSAAASYGAQSISYEPPTGSYEPPTSSYEPPTYQPYNPDEDEKSSVKDVPKKSFIGNDDEDDIATRAAALKKQQKAEADRQADEAFRKAAEADALKDKEAAAAKKSGGWFGSWFKKDPNAPAGPIKAKLGEENSFYYDPELKKWVNKKAGAAEATKPIATPPPPKSGPPSRSVSGNSITANHALGTSLPNAMSAPPSRPPTSNPPRSSSMPPPAAGGPSRASTPGVPSDSEGKPPTLMPPTSLGGSGPPSRPSTGMSNASSIDDLLGAPTARKGASKKGKRGGRYVDVMAKP
ncbi:hypothetical protein CC78DRAFT_545407 [Lojkania enalia]|uniref:Protein transport protein sec16 n=1 Tax=Lojkania enalia TaxID=147567 RepID=A0A9P4K8B4_9PLEO|nr:hypothetical protein CC78DRAFT_545407 [Didymosphaeria enalia]